MDEILAGLPREARVLDLGCGAGSFPANRYACLTIHVDLNPPRKLPPCFVQAHATRLPFRSRTFDAVIVNHALEHIAEVKLTLQEIGRVLKQDGAALITVPDATTLSDRIYRKVLINDGGHVNLFDSSEKLEKMIAWYLGVPHAGTRALQSSFSFLNRRNTRDPVYRDAMVFRGLPEWMLARAVRLARWMDRKWKTRLGAYGWAFYFGKLAGGLDLAPLTNVCVRCGSGHESRDLLTARKTRARFFPRYRCPDCGAINPFTP
jgi:SAM-dependent methyltransferase